MNAFGGYRALAVAMSVGLSGCAYFSSDFSTQRIAEVGIDSVESVLTKVTAKMYPPAKDGTANADLANFEACSRGKAATNDCQAMRNATLATLVGSSDDACNEHLKLIYGKEASWNVGLGTLAALFGGSAAVVGATAAKSNYAAASTFFSSERSLSNEVVYKNQLVPAIHYKILEKRQEKRAALFLRFGASSSEYPFRAAVADAIQYHYNCSFMEGLQWALREGTTNSDDSKLLRARDNLRNAQADLTAAQNAFRARAPSGAASDAGAADPAVAGATQRVTGLNALIRQLELGPAANAASAPVN
jgi:hypothetical protein